MAVRVPRLLFATMLVAGTFQAIIPSASAHSAPGQVVNEASGSFSVPMGRLEWWSSPDVGDVTPYDHSQVWEIQSRDNLEILAWTDSPLASVQVHVGLYSDDPNDPDHVRSPIVADPLICLASTGPQGLQPLGAVLVCGLDLAFGSSKSLYLRGGHYVVWFNAGYGALPYSVHWTARSTTGFPFRIAPYLPHEDSCHNTDGLNPMPGYPPASLAFAVLANECYAAQPTALAAVGTAIYERDGALNTANSVAGTASRVAADGVRVAQAAADQAVATAAATVSSAQATASRELAAAQGVANDAVANAESAAGAALGAAGGTTTASVPDETVGGALPPIATPGIGGQTVTTPGLDVARLCGATCTAPVVVPGVPSQQLGTPPVTLPRTCVDPLVCIGPSTIPAQLLPPTPAVPGAGAPPVCTTLGVVCIDLPGKSVQVPQVVAPGSTAPVSVTVSTRGFSASATPNVGKTTVLGPVLVDVTIPVLGVVVPVEVCPSTCVVPAPPGGSLVGTLSVEAAVGSLHEAVSVPLHVGA